MSDQRASPSSAAEITPIVREMLVIEELARGVLGPREINAIKALGLEFVPRPPISSQESKNTFFLCSLGATSENSETLFAAMVEKGIERVMVTREYVVCCKRRHGTLFHEEINRIFQGIVEAMTNAYRQSPYYC